MAVDTYAFCPCGSGKKIKFCKCKDSLSEIERISKMISGGQFVAALDNLNQVLEKFPAAAWAMALKGRLLLQLQEYDSLEENADRFVRLQPSNPLALSQQAAAHLFHGRLQEATEKLLQGLTETGGSVDTSILDIASALALGLAQNGHVFTSRIYATLVFSTKGYEDQQIVSRVLDEINGSTHLNQLLKTLPILRPRPNNVSWGERYDEAAGLLANQQIMLADSKFQSLLRSEPDEPSILSGALLCAVWQANMSAQSDLMARLAKCSSIPFDERAKLLATAAMLEPERPQISVKAERIEIEIDDVEQVELTLTGSKRSNTIPPEVLQASGEEAGPIRPRSAFQLFDAELPDGNAEPTPEEMPRVLCNVFLFGRQTDRAPRLEFQATYEQERKSAIDLLFDLLGQKPLTTSGTDDVPLEEIIVPTRKIPRNITSPGASDQLHKQIIEKQLPQRLLAVRIPLLGNKSLAESADDESLKLQRTAVIRMLERHEPLSRLAHGAIEEARQKANVDPMTRVKVIDGKVHEVPSDDLGWVDISELKLDELSFFMQRAVQVSCAAAIQSAAKRFIAEGTDPEYASTKLAAYVALSRVSEDLPASLAVIQEGKAWAANADVSDAPLYINEIGVRLGMQDFPGFNQALQEMTTKHGQDPNAMAQLQQLLISVGLLNPDGTPAKMGPAPAAAPPPDSGGLWTPDSGRPTSPPPEDAGGSKLWVPGAD